MSWCRGWMAGAQSRNGQLLYTVWLKCPASCLLKALEKSHTLQLRYVLFTRGLRGDFCSNEPRQRRSTWTSSDNHMRGDNMRRPFPEAFFNQSEVLLPRLWTTMHNTFGWIGIFQLGNLVIYLCCKILSHPFLVFTKYSRWRDSHPGCHYCYAMCLWISTASRKCFSTPKKTAEVWDMSRGLLPSTLTLQSSSATLWAN